MLFVAISKAFTIYGLVAHVLSRAAKPASAIYRGRGGEVCVCGGGVRAGHDPQIAEFELENWSGKQGRPWSTRSGNFWSPRIPDPGLILTCCCCFSAPMHASRPAKCQDMYSSRHRFTLSSSSAAVSHCCLLRHGLFGLFGLSLVCRGRGGVGVGGVDSATVRYLPMREKRFLGAIVIVIAVIDHNRIV